MEHNEWTKSTRSGPWTDNCVEVKWTGTSILVRNSNDQNATMIAFNPDEWKAFLGGAKDGEFDL